MKTNASSPVVATLPRLALCSLALLALAAPAANAASPGCRPIDRLPAVIDEPGLYCLTQDFTTDFSGGAAIEIRADHVTLDFQGHQIDNRSAVDVEHALGVFSWERSHIVVRDGTLIGFSEGIALGSPYGSQESKNHLVETMRVIHSGRTGIGITGNDSIVRGNIVHDTGALSRKGQVVSAISLAGWRNRAIDNDLVKVVGPLGRVGVLFVEGGSHTAVGNRITSATVAIYFPAHTVGAYRDNLANEVPCCRPFEGGTDLGGNHWQ